MQIFNISVSNKQVKTIPPTYHVGAFSTDDFLFTMSKSSQDDYDLDSIEIQGTPFSQKPINKKTIWVHDDNMKYHADPFDYKYKVKVKPINGDPVLEEDPTIVNQ